MIYEALFRDRYRLQVHEISRGDLVHFAGFLLPVESMAKRCVPMLRTGRIGALDQENIRLRDGDTNYTEPLAHLIDAHSQGGFSGSPCFVEHPMIDATNPDGHRIGSWIALLGLVIGHFELYNAGIAVVTPAERIRELLEQEADLVRWREAKEKKAEEKRWENAAVADSGEELSSDFERFEDLTRKLVQVPKKDLDEKRAEDG